MNALTLPNANVAELSAQAQSDASSIRLTLRGTADLRVTEELDQILKRVHAEAVERAATVVEVDLSDLEFMNSSCFKSFVSWITNIQELDADKQYKVKFLSNPSMHWQKRSLHSLRCFAVELITVTEQ